MKTMRLFEEASSQRRSIGNKRSSESSEDLHEDPMEMEGLTNMDPVAQNFVENYFDDFIGHSVYVDCKSWPEKFAIQQWGPMFGTKTTMGLITKVKYMRQTKKPMFEVYFKETEQTVTKLDLDYILTYSEDIPLKYHTLKAEFIVRLARNASLISNTKPAESSKKLAADDSKISATDSKPNADDTESDDNVKPCSGKNKAMKSSTKPKAARKVVSYCDIDEGVTELEMFNCSDIEECFSDPESEVEDFFDDITMSLPKKKTSQLTKRIQ
jgi:hypothetical protein